ncbi:MAG: sensor histidine kinase [Sphingobacteriales bacterium]|nr:MAG: sensor histidine kinase [Sphingobacteriales bacterium]TAF82722.1 MAG: sensor histidine kinase [Sphingobacteriales bacterium]
MKSNTTNYKKSYFLIVSFLVLISISLIVALIVGYNLARKYVESEFITLKTEVMEKSLEPYNTFLQNKIPQVSYYQGFLDSLSAAQFANNILHTYPFVSRVLFYDAEISNHNITDGFRFNKLSIGIKGLYKFKINPNKDSVIIFKNDKAGSFTLSKTDDFNKIGQRFCFLVRKTDSITSLSSDVIFKTFYNISNNKITYMGVPRPNDLILYKQLMLHKKIKSPLYQQDIISFELNPFKIKIVNQHKELYQFISLRKISYDPVYEQPNLVSTNINLPGAFADYKLYFASERNFIKNRIQNRYLPIASGITFIYLILVIIILLLFRNLSVNNKLFQLQYDFINNFTHEFKTPVSVIKIAGNNIKRSAQLSLEEKNHYSKILDEEADKLNDLMNKLLSLAQLESKSITLKYEKLNLEVYVQNIIDSFQFKYPDYEINLEIKDITTFSSDPILLASIFHNLIDNAYKYSTVANKQLSIFIQRNRNNVDFTFTDKGIGIKQSELNNIFKKFYRIQNQYNQQGSVGLGLAFCKELVVFMKGSITVKSNIGEGSCFHIVLPYKSI